MNLHLGSAGWDSSPLLYSVSAAAAWQMGLESCEGCQTHISSRWCWEDSKSHRLAQQGPFGHLLPSLCAFSPSPPAWWLWSSQAPHKSFLGSWVTCSKGERARLKVYCLLWSNLLRPIVSFPLSVPTGAFIGSRGRNVDPAQMEECPRHITRRTWAMGDTLAIFGKYNLLHLL